MQLFVNFKSNKDVLWRRTKPPNFPGLPTEQWKASWEEEPVEVLMPFAVAFLQGLFPLSILQLPWKVKDRGETNDRVVASETFSFPF